MRQIFIDASTPVQSQSFGCQVPANKYTPDIHTCTCTHTHIHTHTQSISLRKCGISDSPNDYILVDVIDSAKGQEKALVPSDLPYTLPQVGYGPLRFYIRSKVGCGEVTSGAHLKEDPMATRCPLAGFHTGFFGEGGKTDVHGGHAPPPGGMGVCSPIFEIYML